MPILQNVNPNVPLVITISNHTRFNALIDTGASRSVISKNLARKLNRNNVFQQLNLIEKEIKLETACSNSITPIGKTVVKLVLGDRTMIENFYITESLPVDCIIGGDLMRKHKIMPDLHANLFYFKDTPEKIYPLNKSDNTLVLQLMDATVSHSQSETEKE